MTARITFIIISLLVSLQFFSQKGGIHQFNRSNGFENAFIYDIKQSPRGYLTISSNYGFYVYDGSYFELIKFSKDNSTRSLSHAIINDDSLLIGVDESLILYNLKKNKVLSSWKLTDFIVKKVLIKSNKEVALLDGNNTIHLINLKTNQSSIIYNTTDNLIQDFNFFNGKLWLADNEGVKQVINGKIELLYALKQEEISLQQISKNAVLVQSRYNSSIAVLDIFSGKIHLSANLKTDLLEISTPSSAGNNQWITYSSSGNLLELQYDQTSKQWSKKTILHLNENIRHKIHIVFKDKENNVWMGSKGGGIYKIDYNPFSFLQVFSNGNQQGINSICAIDDYMALLGTNSGLKLVLADKDNFQLTVENLAFNESVQKIFKQASGKIYFKSSLNLYEFKDGKAVPISFGEYWKKSSDLNMICETPDKIYLATNDGIIIFDKKTKSEFILNTNNHLLHNAVLNTHVSKNDRLWIISPFTIPYSYRAGTIKRIDSSIIKNIFFDPQSILEDKNGNIWFGSKGDGIYIIKQNQLIKLNKDNGIISNNIININDNAFEKIWSLHEFGLTCFSNFKEPRITKAIAFPDEFEPSSSMAGCRFMGNNHGLFLYNPQSVYYYNDTTKTTADNHLPLFIKDFKINNNSLEKVDNIIQLDHGTHRIEIQFQTIYLQKPNMVKYAYRVLGGNDTSWITKNFSEPAIVLSNLSEGTHIIQLKSYLADESRTSHILTYEINIAGAIYKRWWFWLLVITGLSFFTAAIIQWRITKIKRDKQSLEKIVRKRTKELQEEKDNLKKAKDVIEQKTASITESIEYARKIQLSSIPPLDQLKSLKDNTLIYYKPKEIVSGDFYWFKKTEDHLLLAVCDCTGHGVPAGFISMIGIKLISDLAGTLGLSDPAAILNQLNVKLLEELNPETEIQLYNTAMDVAMVSLNLKDNSLIFSGASRPLIIANGNICNMYKGKTMSIGGYNSMLKEQFTNHHLTVEKGDMIYLFTDGFADQINFNSKKRYLNLQLQELLNQINTLSLPDQYAKIDQALIDWKGNANQTDDILIIGLRI